MKTETCFNDTIRVGNDQMIEAFINKFHNSMCDWLFEFIIKMEYALEVQEIP